MGDSDGACELQESKEVPTNRVKTQEDLSSKAQENKGAPLSTWMKFISILVVLGSMFMMFDGNSSTTSKGPLAMPSEVRDHFTRGSSIKVEVGTQSRSIKLFVRTEGPTDGEPVVLVHGMGTSSYIYRKVIPLLTTKGLHTIAVDLPGSGLSEKFTMEEWRHELSGVDRIISRVRGVLDEIMEKGPFWRMEQMFQSGSVPEPAALEEKVEIVQWPVGAFPEESGEAISQVLDSLGVLEAHLVFHDTGSEAARAWALKHPSRVRSVTIIDSAPSKPSLPVFVVGSPGIGSFVLGSKLVYSMVLRSCCVRGLPSDVVEAHAFLLRSGSGRAALLEMAKVANSSDSLRLWSELKPDVPIQVLWSENWSKEWKEQGTEVSTLLPSATTVFHSGSRWPQEDVPEEVAEAIHKFVSSLPRSKRVSKEEKVPEHIQRMFDEMAAGNHGHHHDHGHGHGGCSHGHDHGHGWGL